MTRNIDWADRFLDVGQGYDAHGAGMPAVVVETLLLGSLTLPSGRLLVGEALVAQSDAPVECAVFASLVLTDRVEIGALRFLPVSGRLQSTGKTVGGGLGTCVIAGDYWALDQEYYDFSGAQDRSDEELDRRIRVVNGTLYDSPRLSAHGGAQTLSRAILIDLRQVLLGVPTGKSDVLLVDPPHSGCYSVVPRINGDGTLAYLVAVLLPDGVLAPGWSGSTRYEGKTW